MGQKASAVDMAIGSAVHRRLQKKAKEADGNYQAEVRLSLEEEFPSFILLLKGNADGICLTTEGLVQVDEFKTISIPASLVPQPERILHWAQLKLYGHMLCVQQRLNNIQLCLIYLEYDTDILTKDCRLFSAQELQKFYQQLTNDYARWIHWQIEHQREYQATACALAFPFQEFRQGQRKVAGAVYRAIRDEQDLFLTAPTGIGKTMATLYPAVKAHGEKLGDKIFYLTAKTVTRSAAAAAIKQMEQRGLCHRTVVLTAKEKLCPYALACGPESCPYCKGHFDRINDAVLAILQQRSFFTCEDLLQDAEQFQVCPFELALDLSSWCDLIIGDYNHLFDPVAKLQRFFGGEQKSNHVVLCDEAHNLVDRAREMYSSGLCQEELADTAKPLRKGFPKLYRQIRKMVTWFQTEEKRLLEQYGFTLSSTKPLEVQDAFPEQLVKLASNFIESYEAALAEEAFQPFREKSLPLYFQVSNFCIAAQQYDERYTTYWEIEKKRHHIRLYCLDPSFLVKQCCKKCRSVVFFSATFQPLNYYQRMLSSEGTHTVSVPSPFSPHHLLVLFDDHLSTRYQYREQSFEPIAREILEAISHKIGNYLAFFPSFSFLERVHQLLKEYAPDLSLAAQKRTMNEAERAEFLSRFDSFGKETLLGLAVVGGVFSEGVDLTGERLSGVIISGVGLPQLCFERNLIREYFQLENGKGYDYAYRLPGLNRVFQAVGRLIRTETDRGFALLIDDRYTLPSYLWEYPVQWSRNLRIRSSEEIRDLLRSFWQEEQEK